MPRHVSEDQKRASALQGGQRMIARGQRPRYRVRLLAGRWTVDGLPWVSGVAAVRGEALDAARAAIAEWLEVPPDAFDLES